MRNELIQFLESKNCPDEYDLSRTLWICRKLHSGRFEQAIKDQNEAAKETTSDEEFMTYADDIHWYAYEESFFIWHFCLLRMQAILEGIIVGRYLKTLETDNLHGLKSKLNAMRKMGYNILDVDFNLLLQWGNIRNQLAHYPPSSHSPGPLDETDIIEYFELCLRLCKSWNEQTQKIINISGPAPNSEKQ